MISQGSLKTQEDQLMILVRSREDNHVKHSIWCQWGDLKCLAGKEGDHRLHTDLVGQTLWTQKGKEVNRSQDLPWSDCKT